MLNVNYTSIKKKENNLNYLIVLFGSTTSLKPHLYLTSEYFISGKALYKCIIFTLLTNAKSLLNFRDIEAKRNLSRE